MTDDERQKTETLINRLEIAVGEIFPRDGATAGLIASMISVTQRPAQPSRLGAAALMAKTQASTLVIWSLIV